MSDTIHDIFPHIPYSITYKSDSYPLSLNISIKLFEPEENMYEIELIVPLPQEYPIESIYKQNHTRVAYLSMYYYVNKKQLKIDLFYVYTMKTKYKRYISEHETFHTKGLGKYMLCKAVHYLLDHTDWFDIDSTIKLTAYGEECFNPERYGEYTIKNCLDIIRQYDDSTSKLFYLIITHYNQKLRDTLQIDSTTDIDLFYKQNKELVDEAVNAMVNKKKYGR